MSRVEVWNEMTRSRMIGILSREQKIVYNDENIRILIWFDGNKVKIRFFNIKNEKKKKRKPIIFVNWFKFWNLYYQMWNKKGLAFSYKLLNRELFFWIYTQRNVLFSVTYLLMQNFYDVINIVKAFGVSFVFVFVFFLQVCFMHIFFFQRQFKWKKRYHHTRPKFSFHYHHPREAINLWKNSFAPKEIP